MNTTKYYIAVGLLLVSAVILVMIFTGNEEKPADNGLPPGHPDISQQNEMPGQGEPGKGNVRADFLHQLTQLRKKVDSAPKNDTTGVLTLARMLFDSHQIEESIPYFQRYIAGAPKSEDARIDLSVAYYELQKIDKAIATTDEVLKMNPKNTTAQYNLGVLYAAQGDNAKAKSIWNKLIKENPSSPDAARAKEVMKNL